MQSHLPPLTLLDQSPLSARFTLQIHPDLPWFEGHFPGQPVLPGITQTHWACLLAQDLFRVTGEFSQLKKLKFKSPVLPGQQITLELRFKENRNQVDFAYSDEQNAISSGTIQFTADTRKP